MKQEYEMYVLLIIIIKLFIYSKDLPPKSHIWTYISEAFWERNHGNTPSRNIACIGQVGQPHV